MSTNRWTPYPCRETPLGFAVTLGLTILGLTFLLPEQRWELAYTSLSPWIGVGLMIAMLPGFVLVQGAAHFVAGWIQVRMTGSRSEYIVPWRRSRALRFGAGLGVSWTTRNGHGAVMMWPALAGLLALFAFDAGVVWLGRVGTGVFAYDSLVWHAHVPMLAYTSWMLYEHTLVSRHKTSLQWRSLR